MSGESLQERFSLLASSVACRSVMVVQSESSLAYTDGQIIYVPMADDDKLRMMVIIQALLLAGNSYQKSVLIQLIGRRKVLDRFLTLEVNRVSTLLGEKLPRSLQHRIAAHWVGKLSSSPQESLRRAMSRENIPEPLPEFGTIRPVKLIKDAHPATGGNALSEDELNEALQQQSMDRQESEEEEEKDKSKLLGLMSGPSSPQNIVSKFLRDVFGMGSSPDLDDDQGGQQQLSVGGAQLAKKLTEGAKLIAKTFGFDFSQLMVATGTTYPEWDFKNSAYHSNWCCVHHYDPEMPTEIERSNEFRDAELRRKIARLGTEYQRRRRQSEGEDLDAEAIVDFAVDRAAGLSGSEQVFTTRRKTGRDLGVIILIDTSESTQDKLANGLSIWEQQRSLALNLIRALDELGDSVSAYGFRSFGRNDVRLLRIKQFDKRFDHGARARLFALQPSGFTRLGAAIRHATHLVSTEAGTSNQLIVVISDGIPYEMDYVDEYAQQDVRHALDEAIDNGVGCVCLSVGSSTDADVLEKVWGNVGHANFNSPHELSRYIEPLFRAAIQRATVGGHVQRKVRREAAA